ncbi:MAG: hypothetical protein ACFFCM_20580 [Promethearchaeota archaeon]
MLEEKMNTKLSGFEKEIDDLINTKSFIIEEWKAAYKSMEPKEVYKFLNNWAIELFNLKSETAIDPLTQGVISNILFNQLVAKYPGPLISRNLKEQLIQKMDEKTNPFTLLQKKIDNLLEKGKHKEIKDAISNLFDSYENFIGNKEFLDEFIENFMFTIIENYMDKEIELEILIYFSGSYLNFLKDKKCNINHALFFIKLGSYFFEQQELAMARGCVSKSKQIYKELGYEKDQVKVDAILKKLEDTTPKTKKEKKIIKTKKKKKKKAKKK